MSKRFNKNIPYTFTQQITLPTSSGLNIISNSNTIGSIFTTSGNVGINTTAPSATLDVNGTIEGISAFNTNYSAPNTLQNTATISNPSVLTLLAPNMPTSGTTNFFIGRALSNYNACDVMYVYTSTGSTQNAMRLGFYGQPTYNLSLLGNGNVGINTTSPAYTLDVNGTIARSGVRLPRFDNGSFSGATTGVIPILFNNTQYNYVEIKVRYQVSAICNVTLSGSISSNGSSPFGGSEIAETTVKFNAQSTPVYTNAGYISQTTEILNIDNNFTIKIIRATGGSNGRNHYMFDNVYCWANVGTSRVYGMGHLDTATNLSNALLSIVMTASTGTISGTYSTQHSY